MRLYFDKHLSCNSKQCGCYTQKIKTSLAQEKVGVKEVTRPGKTQNNFVKKASKSQGAIGKCSQKQNSWNHDSSCKEAKSAKAI